MKTIIIFISQVLYLIFRWSFTTGRIQVTFLISSEFFHAFNIVSDDSNWVNFFSARSFKTKKRVGILFKTIFFYFRISRWLSYFSIQSTLCHEYDFINCFRIVNGECLNKVIFFQFCRLTISIYFSNAIKIDSVLYSIILRISYTIWNRNTFCLPRSRSAACNGSKYVIIWKLFDEIAIVDSNTVRFAINATNLVAV